MSRSQPRLRSHEEGRVAASAIRVARRLGRPGIAALVAVVAVAVGGPSAAHATPLTQFIDLQEQGLELSWDAKGLAGWDGLPETLTVEVGGPVRYAVLYWTGRDQPCTGAPASCTTPEPYRDQQISFDGIPFHGTLFANEEDPSGAARANHIVYFADVSSVVGAAGVGTHTFTFADNNGASDLAQLDGVALIVGWTNPQETGTYRTLIYDGLDLAHGDASSEGERTASPVTLEHGSSDEQRQAQFVAFVGGGTASGTDALELAGATRENCFDGGAGAAFDADAIPVTIAPDTTSTTARVVSPVDASDADELRWAVAAMRVPIGAGNTTVEPTDTCLRPPPPATPPAADHPPPPAGPVAPPSSTALPRQRGCPRAAGTIMGTNGDDERIGGAATDVIFGGLGDDVLRGLAGVDCLAGEHGKDHLVGGGARDRLFGGPGPDRLFGGRGADRIDGGAGSDRVMAGPGNDRVIARGSARDTIDCGPGRRDLAIVDQLDRTRRCERVRPA